MVNSMKKEHTKSIKFSFAIETASSAMRMPDYEESKKTELINELKKGEKSGFVKNFNRESFLKNIHNKHVAEK